MAPGLRPGERIDLAPLFEAAARTLAHHRGRLRAADLAARRRAGRRHRAAGAATVIARLRGSVPWPAPDLAGAHWDREATAARIEALRASLEASLDTVGHDRRKAEAAFSAKRRTVAAADEAFARIAGPMEAVYAAAGLPEMAARVHPSGRRPGRTAASVRRHRRRGAARPPGQRVEGGDDLRAIRSGDIFQRPASGCRTSAGGKSGRRAAAAQFGEAIERARPGSVRNVNGSARATS